MAVFRFNEEAADLFQHVVQTVQEIIGLFHAEAEGRKQTDDIRSAYTGEYLLFAVP